MYRVLGLAAVLACSSPVAYAADGATSSSPLILAGDHYSITFSSENGSILAVRQADREGSIIASGESGLWSVAFQDGTTLAASQFLANDDAEYRFEWERLDAPSGLRLTYSCEAVEVEVSVRVEAQGFAFDAVVSPLERTVLEFALPGKLRFDPDTVDRFICPANGNRSVGTAFHADFFRQQSASAARKWEPNRIGSRGCLKLCGGPIVTRENDDRPVPMEVTPAGRAWFGAAFSKRFSGEPATVNRPPGASQSSVTLIDSENGPYFSAKRHGETGLLWRVGGRVGRGQQEKENVLWMVGLSLEKLIAQSAEKRPKIGLLDLTYGPAKGSWTDLSVQEWRDAIRKLPSVRTGRIELVSIAEPREIPASLKSKDFLAIVNPYGEWLPVAEEGAYDATIAAIESYLQQGGNWFETGGYSFFCELRPVPHHYGYESTYPPAFADFFHLSGSAGSAAIYRSAPRQWEPWQAETDPDAMFIPGRLACGSDEIGGWCDRPFVTHVAAGESWRSPRVRMMIGRTPLDDLRAYAEENDITRPLSDKMPANTLETFKQSVLLKYDGTCQEKLAHLDSVPVPSLIHFSDYLHGGFDKQYPDHLPPRAEYGTAEQFREFYDRAHEAGHLLMPYTNPTWWCDDPKGPTFVTHGMAPLARNLDGSLLAERYNENTGFTITHWHGAVRQVNAKTVRQFTEDYPSDLVLQDQCGARRWRYDTNPASPAPHAYTEGMISMVAEDCRTVPLSTEAGWDGVLNFESQLCGLTWEIVPTEGGPSWRRLMKYNYAPTTWTIYPVTQAIAHDKAALLGHDLGQFVTNREVLSWMLGLGFSMSYRVHASVIDQPRRAEWLAWIDRVQKSVCSRYVGEPLVSFEHERPTQPSLEDDGLLRATYGDVMIVANLGPMAKTEHGRQLAPFGFLATAPGMVAGNLASLGGQEFAEEGLLFVTEQRADTADIWVYAEPDALVAVLLPDMRDGRATLAVNEMEQTVTIHEGVVSFQLPGKTATPNLPNGSATHYLWHARLTLTPR